MYYENMILLGDCNFEFDDADVKTDEIDQLLKDINQKELKSKKAAKVNFPLLDAHPVYGQIRTNAQLDQTYDQIGLFIHDARLPDDKANENLTLQAKRLQLRMLQFRGSVRPGVVPDAVRSIVECGSEAHRCSHGV